MGSRNHKDHGESVVIFGAASGLGLGLARGFARRGRRLVLSDLPTRRLEASEAILRDAGADVLSLAADVSDPSQVEDVAKAALRQLQHIDQVINAVGVSSHDATPVWEKGIDDWRWVLDVNFWGALHITRAFIPILLRQEMGQLVHTASSITFASRAGYGPYDASKHAVLSLCQTLFHDLAASRSDVSVSLMIPGAIRSNMADSETARPQRYGEPVTPPERLATMREYIEKLGADPDLLAEILIPQIDGGDFYVFGREEDRGYIQSQVLEVESGRLAPSVFRQVAGPGSLSEDRP